MSLYDDLLAAGAEMDNHESDLYVLVTPETDEIVRRHGRLHESHTFISEGRIWRDLPFAYAPWWRKRGCTA